MLSKLSQRFFPTLFLGSINKHIDITRSISNLKNRFSVSGSLFGCKQQLFLQINRLKHIENESIRLQQESKKDYELGIRFYEGKGTRKDYKKAFNFFHLAAKKGNIEACFNIGIFYYCGLGMERSNIKKSFKYFKIAAENNHPRAQYCYGLCLAKGDGVKINKTKAVRYFRLSAENGFHEAQYCYGRCLLDAFGIKKNLIEASKYFKKASNQGNSKADFFMNCALEKK